MARRSASQLATLLFLVSAATAASSGGQAPPCADGSTCASQGMTDEVGLLQTHAQLSASPQKTEATSEFEPPASAREADVSAAMAPPAGVGDAPRTLAGRSQRWRARARSLREWGDQMVYGLSDIYGAMVMNIADLVPFRRKTHHTNFASLLQGAADTTSAPGISDGGEGMPVGAISCALTLVLMVGLVRWLMTRHLPMALDKEGRQVGLTELKWYHVAMLMQLDCMTPITQDSYIPSMPVMAQHLNTTEAGVGLSLQVNWVLSGILCFGLGMASDTYGRRPVLLGALAFYVAGAILCAVSPTVEMLIIARCVQGVGGGSQALCYAIARDVIQNDDQRSKLFSVFAIAATCAIALAPIAGGLCAVLMGWRMVFLLLAGWGLLAFFNVLTSLPETNPKITSQGPENVPEDSAAPVVVSQSPMMDVFRKSIKPLGLIMSMWMLMPILMSILGSMPFVLDTTYEATTVSITWCTATLAVASLVGSAICFLLINFLTSWQLMRFGMVCLGCVGASLLVTGILHMELTIYTFMVLPACYIMFLSVIMGPIRSLVAQPFGAAAGAANGLVMSVGGPLGALFGFSMTWVLQVHGVFAWMAMLGTLATIHQSIYWGMVGPRAEDDPIFEITEGYLQYLKSKGKGKGKK